MKRKNLEFLSTVKKMVIERSGNRCERCGIDFDEDFPGEFHHIIPTIHDGENIIENCSLLCHDCHLIAPNIKDKKDLLIYKHFFLRFASFKEAAQYYKVDNRLDLYTKIAFDIEKIKKEKS
jgi:hypothetical protein